MNTLKIAEIPDIRAKGGVEMPTFRVTKTELIVVARYWTWVYLDLDIERFLYGCVGRTWRNFFPYACHRVDAAGIRIGVERYRDLTQDIDDWFRSRLGERRWGIYQHGSEEDWDAVRAEVLEELNAQEPHGPRPTTPVVVREVRVPEPDSDDTHAKEPRNPPAEASGSVAVREVPIPEDPADEEELLKWLREAPGEVRPKPWAPHPLVFGHAQRDPRFDLEEESGFVPNMDELTVLAAFWGTVLVEAALGQPGGSPDRTCRQADGQFAEQRAVRLLNLIGSDRAATAASYVHEWASAELGERGHQLFPGAGGGTAKEPAEWLELWTALCARQAGAAPAVDTPGCDPQPKT